MKFLCANRIAPDGTPRCAASHLGLYCLPMSRKRDARLIQFTGQWRITNRSNAIILHTTIGMLFFLVLRKSNMSQHYRKTSILIHSIS